MEKIKNLKYYAMMLIVALTSLSFAACSDDDDFDGDSRLVGYWNTDNGRDSEVLHFIFKGDGTAKQWITYKGELDGEKNSLTWSTPSEGVLVLTGKNPETGKQFTEKWHYSIKDDVLKMIMYDPDGNEYDDAEMYRVKN